MSIIELNAHKFVALCVRHLYHTEGNYCFTKSDVRNFAKKYTNFYNRTHNTEHTFRFEDAELHKEFVKNYLCPDPEETLVPSNAMKLKIVEIIENLSEDEKNLFDGMIKQDLTKLNPKQLIRLGREQYKTIDHDGQEIEDEIVA